jgi:general secretion pathway protein C
MVNPWFFITRLSPMQGRYLACSLISLSSLWLLILFIELGSLLFSHAPLPVLPSLASAPLAVAPAQPAALQQLPQWHLFGLAPVATQTVPLANLNLTLAGIFLQNNKALSRVLITQANGQTQSYRVGDTLGDNILIYSIFSDGIIIEQAGKKARLLLPGRQLLFSNPPQGIF